MLCDKYSTFFSGSSIANAGQVGDTIDLGAAYNIGAGANRPPYLVITMDVANSAAGVLELVCADIDRKTNAVTLGSTLMKIDVPVTSAGEIVYYGILPSFPENAGNALAVKVTTGATGGKATAQIVDNPPIHHIYPAV